MADTKKFLSIQPEELLDAVHKLKGEGYYLIQMCATKVKGSSFVNLDYSFGRDDLFVDLKQEVSEGQEVPSISEIFFSAFLYENEIHELYGVKITNNKIDYNGHLYRTAVKRAFNPEQPAGVSPAAAQPADADTGIVNDASQCVFCGLCAKNCPVSAIAVDRANKQWKINQETCIGCGTCVAVCPKKCLSQGAQNG